MNFNNRMFLIIISILLLNIISISADEKAANIQSVILEDFELTEEGTPKRMWAAIPDRFGREKNNPSGKSLQRLSWIEAWPEAYFGKEGVFDDGNQELEYKTSLAVEVKFNRQGYNHVDLYPLEKNEDGKYVKKPIPFKGRVQNVDLWIWGANFIYDVEMVLVDYRGNEHRLPVGSIKHVGWKNFVVTIPNYIPQGVVTVPRLKTLSLVKLVVWTTPRERVSGMYIYFDHIKYLADVMESKYDGYNLGDPTTVENLWDKGPKAPDEEEIIQ